MLDYFLPCFNLYAVQFTGDFQLSRLETCLVSVARILKDLMS